MHLQDWESEHGKEQEHEDSSSDLSLQEGAAQLQDDLGLGPDCTKWSEEEKKTWKEAPKPHEEKYKQKVLKERIKTAVEAHMTPHFEATGVIATEKLKKSLHEGAAQLQDEEKKKTWKLTYSVTVKLHRSVTKLNL